VAPGYSYTCDGARQVTMFCSLLYHYHTCHLCDTTRTSHTCSKLGNSRQRLTFLQQSAATDSAQTQLAAVAFSNRFVLGWSQIAPTYARHTTVKPFFELISFHMALCCLTLQNLLIFFYNFAYQAITTRTVLHSSRRTRVTTRVPNLRGERDGADPCLR